MHGPNQSNWNSVVLAFQYAICVFSLPLRSPFFLYCLLIFSSDDLIFIVMWHWISQVSSSLCYARYCGSSLVFHLQTDCTPFSLDCPVIPHSFVFWTTVDEDWVPKSTTRDKQNKKKKPLVFQGIGRNEVETENIFLQKAWGRIHMQNTTPGPSVLGRLSSNFFPSPNFSSLTMCFHSAGEIFSLNSCTKVPWTSESFVVLRTKLHSQLHWCKYKLSH